VVSYDFDGANEVCLEGETGFVVRQGDIPGVADRVIRLASDVALRRRMGARGQALVCEQFTVERMVETQYEVYQRLASAKGIQ
jgi:phosphatidylinositol alpha-1,6-mannosyltransferase